MFTLFQTPSWFAGYDLIFDVITLIITLTITFYSAKIYKICDEKKFFYFSVAFGLMSLAFTAKLVTFFTIYAGSAKVAIANTLETLSGAPGVNISMRNLLYRAGFFLQMSAMLGSLLLLFLLSQKARDRLSKMYEVSQIALFTYLITLLAVISTFEYRIFFLTSFVILAMVVLNYYKNYLKTQNKNAHRVMLAFFSLFLAQIAFLFIFVVPELYFVGELFTLLGFSLIALTYIKIQNKAKQYSKNANSIWINTKWGTKLNAFKK